MWCELVPLTCISETENLPAVISEASYQAIHSEASRPVCQYMTNRNQSGWNVRSLTLLKTTLPTGDATLYAAENDTAANMEAMNNTLHDTHCSESTTLAGHFYTPLPH